MAFRRVLWGSGGLFFGNGGNALLIGNGGTGEIGRARGGKE
ncbi:hypothetical protein PJP08_29575 [Mycobacterium kansasii]